jgi:acyl carrier protein
MNRDEILKYVKEELIFKRLRLEDMGVELSEIKDNTFLFDPDGLALESIEVLEIAIGIQQKFGVKIEKLDEETARAKMQTPLAITDFILELQSQQLGEK